jgi:hypothetical protein
VRHAASLIRGGNAKANPAATLMAKLLLYSATHGHSRNDVMILWLPESPRFLVAQRYWDMNDANRSWTKRWQVNETEPWLNH